MQALHSTENHYIILVHTVIITCWLNYYNVYRPLENNHYLIDLSS